MAMVLHAHPQPQEGTGWPRDEGQPLETSVAVPWAFQLAGRMGTPG